MALTQVVTVAFTELVRATEPSRRIDPERVEEAREAHFVLLRKVIASHGGTEVKALGDGLMVVFAVTSGALNCVEAMQQAIERSNKGAPETMGVKIGLSHGEVTEDDGDYFGDAVVEAARLCATARPGQILSTQLVQLTARRRATQQFVALGDLELKGLPEPVPTVEVRWTPAIDRVSPVALPLRVDSAQAGSTFVGREKELATLAGLLKESYAQRQRRIVVVGGEPGIGKTALATAFVRQAHDDGAIVLYGRCDEDLGIPYQPWVEAVAHLVRYAPPRNAGRGPGHSRGGPCSPRPGARALRNRRRWFERSRNGALPVVRSGHRSPQGGGTRSSGGTRDG
jgi:class 3 adenylate cyclase